MRMLIMVVLVSCIVGAGVSLVAGQAREPDEEKEVLPEQFAIPVRLEPIRRVYLDLNVETISVRDPASGELTETHVRLRRTDYRVELVRSIRGRVTRMVLSQPLSCFELVSDGLYTWATWAYTDEFVWPTVLPLPDDRTFIGWIRIQGVSLADVTETRDRTVAFAERFQYRGLADDRGMHIPVEQLVPRARFWRREPVADARHAEIQIDALEVGPDGRLELTVSDPGGPDVVTFFQEEGEWRVKERQWRPR